MTMNAEKGNVGGIIGLKLKLMEKSVKEICATNRRLQYRTENKVDSSI